MDLDIPPPKEALSPRYVSVSCKLVMCRFPPMSAFTVFPPTWEPVIFISFPDCMVSVSDAVTVVPTWVVVSVVPSSFSFKKLASTPLTAPTANWQPYRFPFLFLETKLPNETVNVTLAMPCSAVPVLIVLATGLNWPPKLKKGVQSIQKPDCMTKRKISLNHSPRLNIR